MADTKTESGGSEFIRNIIFCLFWWKLYLWLGGTFTASWSIGAAIASFMLAIFATTIFWILASGVILGVVLGGVELFTTTTSPIKRRNQSEKTKRIKEKALECAIITLEEQEEQHRKGVAERELEEFLKSCRPHDTETITIEPKETTPDWREKAKERTKFVEEQERIRIK